MQKSLLFALLAVSLTGSVSAATESPVTDTPAAVEAREAAVANAVPVSDAEDSRWTRTLERVASGVVTI